MSECHLNKGTFISGSGGGGARDMPPRGPNSFIFMQFSAKDLHINRLGHPPWELAPSLPPGKF